MEIKTQLELEAKQYSEKVEELKVLIESISYHKEVFPKSFEKHYSLIISIINSKKLDSMNLMNKVGWNFDLILTNIDSYKGFELDLIIEIVDLIEEYFEELLNEDRSYCFACEGVKDWIEILCARIKRNERFFEYAIKEMKDYELSFEKKIADWLDEIYSELGTLDYNYFINLFLEENENMNVTILKLQEIPFVFSKFFDSYSTQLASGRLNYLETQPFKPPRYCD